MQAPPISRQADRGGFVPAPGTETGAVILTNTLETTGLCRSLPTNIGDVRPVHVNVNSLRNTTAARYSCDTLCGNWSEERRDTMAMKVGDDAVLRKSMTAHLYQSVHHEGQQATEADRRPTEQIVEDEGERLQTTTARTHTNQFLCGRNEKTQEVGELFKETDQLREYRAKWTSRPLIKETEHSIAFQDWGAAS